MPQMKARARVVVEFPVDIEVPDLDLAPTGDGDRAPLRATNEEDVLDARAEAARYAERAAAERFPDAVEIVIEEVSEG